MTKIFYPEVDLACWGGILGSKKKRHEYNAGAVLELGNANTSA